MKNMIGSETNKIVKSSFHDCKSFCLDVDNARHVRITDNVFYKGRKFHARALNLYDYKFEDNLMIAATKRPTLDMKELIACYGSWQEINKIDDLVSVTNNLCQGSDLHGFALSYVPCDRIDEYAFAGNTAGSTSTAFIFQKVSGTCQAAAGIRAYASGIGQIASSVSTKELMFDNFIIADSGRGATLRFGHGGRRNNEDFTGHLKNSYITAISRPSCTQCYGTGAIDCTDNFALRLLAVTVNGESLPDKFGNGFDVICKNEQFDSKAFLDNVTFANYRNTYS